GVDTEILSMPFILSTPRPRSSRAEQAQQGEKPSCPRHGALLHNSPILSPTAKPRKGASMELNSGTVANTRTRTQPQLARAMSTVNGILLGKDRAVRLCFACILARGHLLIEDVPGVGKTTLAQTLAHALGLEYRRVQFTSDLLPADILGASVWHRDSGEFRFQPGPIFSQLILADEVNRATPKTQSALLEAMEEHQVTIDGATRHLPEPFFVIATQNPHYQIGTFPLPESQLDRFLMRI